MRQITPHLWFDSEAREAAEWYSGIIPGSQVNAAKTLPGTPSGDSDVVWFDLAGAPFLAINAGPEFRFNPATSFQIRCATADDVDAIWKHLAEGSRVLMPLDKYPFSERYGWLADRYGLSWQVMHAGERARGQRVVPALMFVGEVCGKAEEATNFYASVFKGRPGEESGEDTSAQVLSRYEADEEPDKEGTARYAEFRLAGEELAAMDSARAHDFAFNEAVSLLVPCDTQEEIDYFSGKLSTDPKAEQCGWLKDKYGLSWQIASAAMLDVMRSADPAQLERMTKTFLKMKKINIAELERAAAG